jgi:hypothetical protein
MARVFYTVRMHFENLATIEKQAENSQQAGTNLEPASQEERRSCVMCQVAVAFLVVVLLRLARIGCRIPPAILVQCLETWHSQLGGCVV